MNGNTLRSLACAALLCIISASTFAASADDIKALLQAGNPREAYDTGKSHAEELGSPLFDFYFGIAALDAGVPGEGVLAL